MFACSEGEYKEKGSKFIGLAAPCSSEEEAKKLLEEWKKQHHQARHLCYAYRLDITSGKYRANDDGEPSNSAGKPILGQLESFELFNVLVGVVRYYGGVKLGVGGLINAYRTAAKEAIENGKIIEQTLQDYFSLFFDYSDMALLMDFLKKNDICIIEQLFDTDCYLKIRCNTNDSSSLLQRLENYESLKIKKIGTF